MRVAGWCFLVTILLILLAKFSKLMVLSFVSEIMMVVDFAMLIWVRRNHQTDHLNSSTLQGSVVVLGAWAEWNVTPALAYDVEGSCHATPMVAAFAILVVKWLMFFAPIIAMLLMCVCGCALAPFACCAAMCCKKEEAAASA